MDKQWYTVGEIEQQTRIPERTIRRYLDIHGHHIKTKRQGRSVLVADEAVQVIRDIRGMYDAGMSSDRVEESLAQSGLPMLIEVDGHETAMTPVEALQGLQRSVAEAMAAMTNQIDELRQEVAATKEQNRDLKDFIEQRIEQRDKLLMETLRTMRETAQELKENRKKSSWWPFSRK